MKYCAHHNRGMRSLLQFPPSLAAVVYITWHVVQNDSLVKQRSECWADGNAFLVASSRERIILWEKSVRVHFCSGIVFHIAEEF